MVFQNKKASPKCIYSQDVDLEERNNEVDWANNNRNDGTIFGNPQHCTISRGNNTQFMVTSLINANLEPSVRTSDATSCQEGMQLLILINK